MKPIKKTNNNTIKLQINEKFNLKGIYDPGSQISLINSKLLKLKGADNGSNKANLATINGVQQAKGLTNLKVKIFEMEKNVDVYIIDEQFHR